MILAQAAPNPSAFSEFWIIVAFLAAIAANLVTVIVLLANRKQKREVSFTEEPASKREFDAHCKVTHDNFEQVRAEMKEDRQENQVHASARSQTIFNKIELIRTELDTKIDDTRRELTEQIRDVPERVLTTLKNTGAI